MRQSKFVTRTGRAISPGRVTRKSREQRPRPRGMLEAPLPATLAVHPKRLAPTPRHPGCLTMAHHVGMARTMRYAWALGSLIRGAGLSRRPLKYGLYVQPFEKARGYTDDLTYALAWRDAARDGYGLKVTVVEE